MGFITAFKLVKHHWKLIIALVVIVLTLAYVAILHGTISEQSNRIAELTAANVTLKENNVRLQSAITLSNTAIDKLAQGADATNKAFKGLNSLVKAQSSDLEARLRIILQEKKPQTCEDTILYLIQAAREMKQ